MELGEEISQKVKRTIKKQLQTLGCYVDDELPEYIMVMIANKRTQAEMVEDLNLFLNDEAEKFVSWLIVVLGRIQRAMELPDIDGIAEDVGNSMESKKKLKKLKKDRKPSDCEENIKNEKHDRRKSEEKKRTKEGKDKDNEEKEREKRKQERLDKQNEKEVKESERKEKEQKQRLEERLRREKEREESTKRHIAREDEINKRRAARERRDKDEKEKREERKKKEKEEQEEREKQKKHEESKQNQEVRRIEDEEKQEKEIEHTDNSDKEKMNGLDDTNYKETDADVRREAEHEAKRIENRGSRNPMEFVKQIAKNITDQLQANQSTHNTTTTNTTTTNVEKVEKVNENEINKAKSLHAEGESKKDPNDSADLTLCENVSLQAVSQYEDGENDVEKGDSKSQHKSKKHHKQRQHRSGNRSSTRSRSNSETRHHNHKEAKSGNKTRTSKSRSCERGRKHRRSRSRSKERKSRKDNERKSSSKKDDHPSENHASKAKNEPEDSSKKRNNDNSKCMENIDLSKIKDSKTESPRRRRRSSHSHQRRRDSNEGSCKINNKDMTDKVVEEESPAKPSMSSQVQIFTDFKRKPSLAKHHQASSVLLKRAVTEVVNEKPEGEENGDDVELDYNETNDENEVSDEASDEVILERRRVINFDKEKSGLPTITVNFNKDNSSNSDNDNKRTVRSNDRDRNRMSTIENRHSRTNNHVSSHVRKSSDDKDSEKRKGLIPGISKYDARYTILRSRLENEIPSNERNVRHEKKQEKTNNREKGLGSMVADLEEKWKKHNTTSTLREQRKNNEPNNKHRERQRVSQRRHMHTADGESSCEDEEDKQLRVKELKKEARRIEMQELSRSGQSDEGDLRDLLVGKRDVKSSSEEEDVIAQRLREKIKEEKHKRLFGKLNTEDRDRSRKERENLRDRLKIKKKRRKLTGSNDSPEWIEKVPEKCGESKDCGDDNDKSERNIYLENVTDSDEEYVKEEAATEGEYEKDNTEEGVNSEKMAVESEVETDDESKGDDDDEDKQEEEEELVNHRNDLEEVSDEELADDSEKEMDDDERNGMDINMETGEQKGEIGKYIRGELESNKPHTELCEEFEEEEEEEVEELVEIEVEVSDNENLEGNENEINAQGMNKDTDKSNKRDNENYVTDIMEVGKENVHSQHNDKKEGLSTEVLKHSMHLESSEESPINEDNPNENNGGPTEMKTTEKYEKKSKQRYSKRKRIRHEFFVTLDGLADGKRLSIKTGTREKSPKVRRLQDKQKSDRHRRHRHISRSQSDEEFEEILRRKEEEEKRSIGQSRISESKKARRSRSQPSNDKDSKLSAVDREIILAENKLKTQKVFKKSLETVQNVTNNLSVTNVTNNLEQGTIKSAFINPNFQAKLPVETINAAVAIIPSKIGFSKSPIKVLTQAPALNPKPICNLGSSIPEKVILATPVLSSTSEKRLVPPVHISRSKDFVLPSAALDIVALPHVDISVMNKNLIKPTIDNSTETLSTEVPASHKIHMSTNNVDDGSIPATSATEQPASEESRSAAAATASKATIQERCVFWPECKNQTCPFIHPSINCKLFPNCSYGQHCIYIHPPCMFGDSCSNASCPFTHVSSAPSVFSGFSQNCKYYPNCTKVDCPFKHVDKPCHYGTSCKNVECMFSHDETPLPVSSLKWVAEKAHVSERKFAADDAIVSHIPVSIVTSNG